MAVALAKDRNRLCSLVLTLTLVCGGREGKEFSSICLFMLIVAESGLIPTFT